jgi:hypothetical protein
VDKLRFVTYCGLYCGLCAQRGRIPRQAQALRGSMSKEGYEFWGREIPGFEAFWGFLANLGDPDKACPGCRQDGGYPACEIRICARERQIEVCALCEQFPCERIQHFAKVYPTLITDGERLREIGVDAWLAEQDQRAETGFAYADIRYERSAQREE